jgi:hypothetical protein
MLYYKGNQKGEKMRDIKFQNKLFEQPWSQELHWTEAFAYDDKVFWEIEALLSFTNFHNF